MNDDTLDRLRRLNARLTECLVDAADIRARITKARRDATAWPDLRLASRVDTDIRSSSRFHPSNASRRTN